MTQQELNDIYSFGIVVMALLGLNVSLVACLLGFLVSRRG